jgi:hypothetical protein
MDIIAATFAALGVKLCMDTSWPKYATLDDMKTDLDG